MLEILTLLCLALLLRIVVRWMQDAADAIRRRRYFRRYEP